MTNEERNPTIDKLEEQIRSTDERLNRDREHLREFSAFISRPMASSSPLSYSSMEIQHLKALVNQQDHQRSHSCVRGDLFLKPLPAYRYSGRPILTSHMTNPYGMGFNWGHVQPFEMFHPHGHCYYPYLYRSRSEPSAIDQDSGKYPAEALTSSSEKEELIGILKKSKESPPPISPTDTGKEIKVYQSGGTLILQNIKGGLTPSEHQTMSEMSSKLIGDCHKLSESLKEETKESKMVQFDLSSSVTSTPDKTPMEVRNKEQPSSISTNESLSWQPTGMSSPGSSIGPRMEWDSAADVGYGNSDKSKELSTLERITLQGLVKQGKKVMYKTSRGDQLRERIPSDVVESEERRPIVKDSGTNPEEPENILVPKKDTSDSNTQTTDETETTLQGESVISDGNKDASVSLERTKQKKVPRSPLRRKPSPSGLKKKSSKGSEHRASKQEAKTNPPEMKDMSTNVNTLGEEFGFYKLPSSESSDKQVPDISPRIKRLKKKRPDVSIRTRKILEIIDIAKSFEGEQGERRVEEITVDHTYREKDAINEDTKLEMEEKTVQTSDRAVESKGVQAGEQPKRKVEKCVQASGESNSLPRHLDGQHIGEMAGGEVRTKSTQFFGEGANSLPRGLEKGERMKKVPLSEKSKHKAEKKPPQLTEQSLKQRKETVDPLILQKKFFESQKKFISCSTSMENPGMLVSVSTSPLYNTVNIKPICISAGTSMEQDVELPPVVQTKSIGVQCSHLGNKNSPAAEEETDSSTQTTHSWLPNGRPVVAAQKPFCPRARSFEYLPGDVYESSNNLREKLPSETSQNVITESDSSESEASSPAESEGGGIDVQSITGTVVLDDSNASTPAAWLVVNDDSPHVKLVRKTVANKNGELEKVTCNEALLPAANNASLVCNLSQISVEQKMESGNVRRLVAWFQSLDNSNRSPMVYQSQPFRAIMLRNRHLFALLAAYPDNTDLGVNSSESSKNTGNSAEVKSATACKEFALNRVEEKRKVKNYKRLGNSPHGDMSSLESFASLKNQSAGVQTDSKLDSGREVDLYRVLQEIQQAINRLDGRQIVASLDRKSKSLSRLLPVSKTSESLDKKNSKVSLDGKEVNRACSTPITKTPDNVAVTDDTSIGTVILEDSNSPKADALLVVASGTSCALTSEGKPSEAEASSSPKSLSSTSMRVIRSERRLADRSTQINSSLREAATQMSPSACQFCSLVPCICGKVRADQGTQMSHRSNVSSKSEKLKTANAFCRKCQKTDCVCLEIFSSGRNLCEACKSAKCSSGRCQWCQNCKKADCVCGKQSSRRNCESSCPSQEKVKVEASREKKRQVSSKHLGDFSSSELVTSSSSETRLRKNGSNKENCCVVCKCSFGVQNCVFCSCHIDKNLHIPKCECHQKSPRYLIPGFCKCHKRNLRCFEKCRCKENDLIKNNKCPCCEYFADRMRANVLAAQLEGVTPSQTGRQPLPKPKQYFLKLEETEVSRESTDVSEQERRPLDVVTIKIPVKRMGKAKVPCKNFYYGGQVEQSSRTDENGIEFLDDIVRKYHGLLRERSNAREKPNESRTSREGTLSLRSGMTYRTLQECLESNRPDFVSSAEYRRRVISERRRERAAKQQVQPRRAHNNPFAETKDKVPARIFTTAEIHEQTKKRCKLLSEVTSMKEERRKVERYKTNRLNAEIFAKRLQLKALRGQLDISNSCNLLAM